MSGGFSRYLQKLRLIPSRYEQQIMKQSDHNNSDPSFEGVDEDGKAKWKINLDPAIASMLTPDQLKELYGN